tara:strand:- start:96 stop:335 length:240 start_codon:yes stop_codon:yes gene_type:complete
MEIVMFKSIPYTPDAQAIALGLKARGLTHDQKITRVIMLADLQAEHPVEDKEYTEYECTCCYSIQQGHQDHCGTWLNEE